MPSDTKKVAAVTGGNKGIGRAISRKLASEGAFVAISGRDADAGRSVVEEIQQDGGEASFTQVDVGKSGQVVPWIESVANEQGRVDWLVNNAGMNGRSARLEEYSLEEFEEVVYTNLLGAFYATHTVIPIMRNQGSGAIVNIGSTASLQGYALLSGYTASKHGVLGLTKSTALENADVPIRCNCVCPGPIDTPLMEQIEKIVNPDDPAAAREMFESTTALKRYGQPGEISGLVHYLLDGDSEYITGTAISIDGGVTTGVG